MCVADSKPTDPPVKRAWAIWHNAATVAQQAQEGLAVAEAEYAREKNTHTREAVRLAERTLKFAGRAAEEALLAFAEIRADLGLPIGTSEEWEKEHALATARNQADH